MSDAHLYSMLMVLPKLSKVEKQKKPNANGYYVANWAWRVRGVGGRLAAPAGPVDTGNSGTTARFLTAAATLAGRPLAGTDLAHLEQDEITEWLSSRVPIQISSCSFVTSLATTTIRSGPATVVMSARSFTTRLGAENRTTGR